MNSMSKDKAVVLTLLTALVVSFASAALLVAFWGGFLLEMAILLGAGALFITFVTCVDPVRLD